MHHHSKTQKLTQTERHLIAKWKNEQGLSNGAIAKYLGRHKTSIGRELKRNQYHGKNNTFYEPLAAQAKADSRKARAWKSKQPLKNKPLFDYVMDKLKQGWSPEQISGRLKNQEHAGDKDRQISFEAIYQFVYSEDQAHHQYWQYLRRGHKKRRKQKTGRKVHRSRIPDRVSIHQRPRIVDKRQQPGHWEGDTIVGKGRDHGLHTAYERVSSYIRFEYMDKHDSNSSLDAQLKIYGSLPQHMRRTTTVDNGKEHVKHTMLKQELGMDTYFADPYSSWQRGGNENANLWIRYYFPKRTDFRTIPTAELRAVEWELNNRPRKRLNYQTPQEVFSKLMQQGLRS